MQNNATRDSLVAAPRKALRQALCYGFIGTFPVSCFQIKTKEKTFWPPTTHTGPVLAALYAVHAGIVCHFRHSRRALVRRELDGTAHRRNRPSKRTPSRNFQFQKCGPVCYPGTEYVSGAHAIVPDPDSRSPICCTRSKQTFPCAANMSRECSSSSGTSTGTSIGIGNRRNNCGKLRSPGTTERARFGQWE